MSAHTKSEHENEKRIINHKNRINTSSSQTFTRSIVAAALAVVLPAEESARAREFTTSTAQSYVSGTYCKATK